jgi:hypothetical protein
MEDRPVRSFTFGHGRIIGHRTEFVGGLEHQRQEIHVADRVQEKPRAGQHPVNCRPNIRLVFQWLIPGLPIACGTG